MENIRPKAGSVNKRRANFAKALALDEFGRRNYHPDWAAFEDRTPEQIKELRRRMAT